MDIYNKSYFNRRNWILENYKDLNLSVLEGLTILMIDFLDEQNESLSLAILSEKLNVSEKEVDTALSSLATKGYLKIEAKDNKIKFNINGIFQEKKEKVDLRSIFDLFEEEFGRLLKQNELVELNEWIQKYKEEDIITALRQASIYNKKSFSYIGTILNSIANGHKND